jgi:hypothetical protein
MYSEVLSDLSTCEDVFIVLNEIGTKGQCDWGGGSEPNSRWLGPFSPLLVWIGKIPRGHLTQS